MIAYSKSGKCHYMRKHIAVNADSLNSKHRSLSKGLGFHTYVCWASDKDNWNVTAYFNPEVYHESRMVTK